MQETWELIFQLGISPGGGHGNPFQYSYLENPHRQRNLMGYGPFCSKELDITDQLSTHNIYICIQNISVQFSSVAQSCPTLCDPMNHSTSGLPVHHQLLEFTQTHIHRVSDAIQPSHPLWSPSPPSPNPFQYQGLFQ